MECMAEASPSNDLNRRLRGPLVNAHIVKIRLLINDASNHLLANGFHCWQQGSNVVMVEGRSKNPLLSLPFLSSDLKDRLAEEWFCDNANV
mmetsp:Transcript_39578/g.55207  ORF Transcript_39578/g.55207 Transcript_39578/m.55207 type:complete len:91 (-) Transcript_39578:203-475(-)